MYFIPTEHEMAVVRNIANLRGFMIDLLESNEISEKMRRDILATKEHLGEIYESPMRVAFLIAHFAEDSSTFENLRSNVDNIRAETTSSNDSDARFKFGTFKETVKLVHKMGLP